MSNGSSERHDYDPLDRTTFDAIAYNVVGRASEIGTYPALNLTHSSGNSGWSVGIVQWDFGQPGRGAKVHDLMAGYQAWASPDHRYSPEEVDSLTERLQTRGQTGNALTVEEESRLNEYLRSDSGRAFVGSLNQEQITKKWGNVGEPLSEIEWLRDLRATDPAQATEIVTQTMKLYNQNEIRGARLISHLQSNELTATETRDWIGTVGIDGLNQNARAAIVSGRDNAIAGARLMNDLELGSGRLAQAWRREVHNDGNPSLLEDFNAEPDVQLLDAMMRNPSAARAILDHVDNGEPARSTLIRGINRESALEMSRVELSREGTLTVTSPAGDAFRMTREGWDRNGIPMQDGPQGRAMDDPHHTEGLRQLHPRPSNHAQPSDDDLLERIRDGVRGLDRQAGKDWDDNSERLSAALLVKAREQGFTGRDELALAFNNPTERHGSGALVHLVRQGQGASADPAANRAHVVTEDALRTQAEDSFRQAEVASRTRAEAQQLAQQQEAQRQQSEHAMRV